jgi:hypothetical protein
LDGEDILGVKLVLEDLGHSVYIDWIEDPQLGRSDVSRDNADTLPSRILVGPFFMQPLQEVQFQNGCNGSAAILMGAKDELQFSPSLRAFKSSTKAQNI